MHRPLITFPRLTIPLHCRLNDVRHLNLTLETDAQGTFHGRFNIQSFVQPFLFPPLEKKLNNFIRGVSSYKF